MFERHRSTSVDSSPAAAGSAGSRAILVESADGNVAELDVRADESMADVRRRAAETLGLLGSDPNGYFLLDAGNRVVDPAQTVQQALAAGQTRFQLYSQPQYGRRPETGFRGPSPR